MAAVSKVKRIPDWAWILGLAVLATVGVGGAMFRFKEGVLIDTIEEPIRWALEKTAEVYGSRGIVMTVTSFYRPGDPGFHGKGLAFDVRMKDVLPVSLRAQIRDEVALRLGSDYDVVRHGVGDNDHLHVEYDPS